MLLTYTFGQEVGLLWCHWQVKNLPVTQKTQEAWVRSMGQEEGNGNPLQDPCLENPRTEEPSGLQSMGVAKRQTGLSD